jgi:YD repeat-containing protein
MTYDALNRLKTVTANGANGRTIEYQYNADGNVVQTYSYDTFGNVTQTGSVSQPYIFTGREYDQETGMYFYRARYYDTKVGGIVKFGGQYT